MLFVILSTTCRCDIISIKNQFLYPFRNENFMHGQVDKLVFLFIRSVVVYKVLRKVETYRL